MSPTVPHHSLLSLVCFCFIISQTVQATANHLDSTLLDDKNKVEDNIMVVTLVDTKMVKLQIVGMLEPQATTYAAELWVTCLSRPRHCSVSVLDYQHFFIKFNA